MEKLRGILKGRFTTKTLRALRFTKKINLVHLSALSVLVLNLLPSCNNNQTSNSTKPSTNPPKEITIATPSFDADSAYSFVKTQVDFTPRTPGSKAHDKCAEYLTNKLKSYNLQVVVQHGMVSTYDTKQFNISNIIGSYKPELKNRILLLTHWDSRPRADMDSVDMDKPIDGADDGASGVAVLLEIARQLSILKPNCGVDIFFSDLEDDGENNNNESWCLGTQYWIKHPTIQNYNPSFGILLDMVGGKNPLFPMEGTGMHYAPSYIQRVWDIAGKLGFAEYFTDTQTGTTIDDHFFINRDAHIPCIDIVHYEPQIRDYPYYHHKHSDNISVIDKNTLKMVGQVVLAVILNEGGA
jgi:glutaminyl-peptide cyclotransferase